MTLNLLTTTAASVVTVVVRGGDRGGGRKRYQKRAAAALLSEHSSWLAAVCWLLAGQWQQNPTQTLDPASISPAVLSALHHTHCTDLRLPLTVCTPLPLAPLWFVSPQEEWPEDAAACEQIKADFCTADPSIGDRRQELVFIGQVCFGGAWYMIT